MLRVIMRRHPRLLHLLRYDHSPGGICPIRIMPKGRRTHYKCAAFCMMGAAEQAAAPLN